MTDLKAEYDALHALMIWESDSDDLRPEFRHGDFRAKPFEERADIITARRKQIREEMGLPEPEAYSKDEAIDVLLKQMAGMAHYWANVPDDSSLGCQPKTPLDRINGFAFSMLSLIDGSNMGFPAFNLVPAISADDIEFHKAEGERYFAPDEPINDETALHEVWGKYELGEDGEPVR